MRLIIILLLVAGVCMWWGTQNTLVALRDRTQTEMTCADYLSKRPEGRWLKLTKCEYDFDHMAYEQYKSGKISKVYLPVRPEGEEEGRPTRIVVVREDDDMLKVAQALENDDAEPQPATFNVTTSLTKPVEGLVQFGLDLNDKDKDELKNLGLGLDRDFVLIDYNDKPKLQKGLIVLAIGLGAIGLLTFLLIRRFRKPKATPMPPGMQPPSNNPIQQFEQPI